MRTQPNPDARPRLILGGSLIALSLLGLRHLWSGSPEDPELRRRAGGFIGFAIGGPLSDGLTPWIAAPLLFIGALFGLLLLTGTTIREVPEVVRAMFGTRPFQRDEDDYEDGQYEDGPTEEQENYDQALDEEPPAWPSANMLDIAPEPDDTPTIPEPALEAKAPVAKTRRRAPRKPDRRRRRPLHAAVAGPAGGGRPAQEAQRRQQPDGRRHRGGAHPVQGRRGRHRLHPRAHRHPLRGRAGPRRQGREDHRAAEEHRLRGGHRERPHAGADPRQVRRRHRGAQHRPGNGAAGRRAHRAVHPAATTTRW